ncbi:Hsp70 protein-domain-containing protein [Bisporella sp. PMI_857]|nr:Hsp70 protein-domain-containing protein [Bisporella sp. PMI_857]
MLGHGRWMFAGRSREVEATSAYVMSPSTVAYDPNGHEPPAPDYYPAEPYPLIAYYSAPQYEPVNLRGGAGNRGFFSRDITDFRQEGNKYGQWISWGLIISLWLVGCALGFIGSVGIARRVWDTIGKVREITKWFFMPAAVMMGLTILLCLCSGRKKADGTYEHSEDELRPIWKMMKWTSKICLWLLVFVLVYMDWLLAAVTDNCVLVALFAIISNLRRPRMLQIRPLVEVDNRIQVAEFSTTGYYGEEDGLVIGIDLGTTNCRVGISRGGNFEIIPDEKGRVDMPSYVSFINDGYVTGHEVKALAELDPKKTIHGMRHLLGRKFNSGDLQYIAKHVAFDIAEENGLATVEITIKRQTSKLSPEEVLAKLIQQLKRNAELYLDQKIRYAVVTVPATFDDLQRELTNRARRRAGLHFIRLVNEPTAAMSIVEAGVFEIQSTFTSWTVGGIDFDLALLNYVVKEYNQRNNADITKDLGAMGGLRYEVKAAESTLLSNHSTTIGIQTRRIIPSFNHTIIRAQLSELRANIFAKAQPLLSKALKEVSSQKSAVDTIIVTGKPSHVAMIKLLLKEYFDGKEVYEKVPSDETFVRGAAIHGRIMSRYEPETIPWDGVVRLGLGVEIAGGIFRRRETFNKHNELLGIIEMDGISPQPAGAPNFEITFEFYGNYTLKVILLEAETNRKETLVIKTTADFKRHSEADRVEKEAKIHYDEDMEVKQSLLESLETIENAQFGVKINMNRKLNEYLDEYSGKCIVDHKT